VPLALELDGLLTAAQRDWLLRTRVAIGSIRFHRFEATSSALVWPTAVRCTVPGHVAQFDVLPTQTRRSHQTLMLLVDARA
jgi:hypothetical protein